MVVAAALFSASLISRPREPAASAAASSPNLLFIGNFESGTFKPWGTPQCANYGQPTNATRAFGNFSIVSDIVGQGAYAARFDVPADPTHLTRCQVITNVPRQRRWRRLLLTDVLPAERLATGITPPQFGVIIAQLNHQRFGPGSPTSALLAFPDHVTLVMQTGITTTGKPAYQYVECRLEPLSVNLPKLYAVPPGMHWRLARTDHPRTLGDRQQRQDRRLAPHQGQEGLEEDGEPPRLPNSGGVSGRELPADHDRHDRRLSDAVSCADLGLARRVQPIRFLCRRGRAPSVILTVPGPGLQS